MPRQTPLEGSARKPAWLKVRPPAPGRFRATGALLEELALHTVCEEARCPNKSECFSHGTATFMILGDRCTRSCGFCSVGRSDASAALGCTGRDVDADEPRRVAEAAVRLGLRHVVVTSVTRDDLADGGAAHFAATIAALRAALPAATVEVLIPDFLGDAGALSRVLSARPDVLGHNLETVPRLYALVRPQAEYRRSLLVLERAAGSAPVRRPLVKTGLMLGLGESTAEVDALLGDCVAAGVDIVTVGQYLRPARDRLPVARYVGPREFSALEDRARVLGLEVVAGPFVRSSYRAGDVFAAAASEDADRLGDGRRP